jgi:threonine 3-dehydrogenase
MEKSPEMKTNPKMTNMRKVDHASMMQAVVKERPEPGKEWPKGLDLVEKEVPQPREPNDVKIRVIAAGICGTDVGIYNSKESLREEMSGIAGPNVTLGHEFCGTIVDAAPKARKVLAEKLLEKSKAGGRAKKFVRNRSAAHVARDSGFLSFLGENYNATAEMHITCGVCYQCRHGEKHVCRNTIIKGIQVDGAFAEYLTVPAENILLFEVGEIPVEVIAFMDALGNATHTVHSAPVKGKTVAVLGCGVQGLMAIAVAKYSGASKIYATDASHGEFTHEKLESNRFRLAKLYGARDCFDVNIDREKERFYKTVMKETNDTGVDVVFEMSGNYRAYEDAFKIVRMGGTISLLGLPGGQMVVDFSKDIIFRGITIHGIIGRRVFETWTLMTGILKKGLAKKFIDTGFITHDLPLEEYKGGFNAIMNGDAMKVLLRP